MEELINGLIESGVIDAEAAQFLRRQLDPEFARTDAEERLFTAALGALQQQQESIIAGVEASLSQPEIEALFDATESLLADAFLPVAEELASERAIGQMVSLSATVAESQIASASESVLQWANTYYLSLSDDDKGSVPNLNITSRSRFLNVFERWNRGQLSTQQDGRGRGLPGLIEALESTFGPTRAEAIASTETSRIFGEAATIAGRASDVVNGFRWSTAADEAVCPICEPLDGVIIPVDEDDWVHPDPEIGKVRHPAHTRCRCDKIPVTELAQ